MKPNTVVSGENKKLLGDEVFAALRRDLEDSEKAEILFDQTILKGFKANRLNKKLLQGIAVLNTESPTKAVTTAINR